MANIELRSLQSILGSMIGRVKAETDVNDVSPGSVLMTILEAAASSDFIQEGKLIQLLNLRDIDKASGIDLENLAYEMGLQTTRFGAAPASVLLTITDSAFERVASTIYAGSVAPAAGDTTIKIVDGSSFSTAGGTIYIGRGGQTAETVDYINMVAPDPTNASSPPYYILNLAAPLTKDHLVGEEVVLSQGGDRTISAGTVAIASLQGGGSSVSFATQRAYTLLDGENRISGVMAVASEPGANSNVAVNKVSSFQGQPWSTASVINDEASSGGRDPETDVELRQRIKDHVHALTAGTERAVIRAVVGASDDEEKKRVISAFLRKPTDPGDPAVLFIDDGTGFAPSFSGIGEEVVVTSASGAEKYFQLQKWPLVKAQVASIGSEPFAMFGGESLYVEVDGESEERTLPATSFRNLGQATAQEIAESINARFNLIEARAKNGTVFLTPTKDDPDSVRVGSPVGAKNANDVLRFPVENQYTVRLYKNDTLLEKNGAEASIQTLPYNTWSSVGADPSGETLQLRIDGIDGPVAAFTNLDFAANTSSTTVQNATVSDWVTLMNKKLIGIRAVAAGDTVVIRSNAGRTSVAEVSVLSGSLASKIFAPNTSSVGKDQEFKLNRLLGQIELTHPLSEGDELKVGNTRTRGFAVTGAQSSFDLSSTPAWNSVASNDKPAEIVFVSEAEAILIPVAHVGEVQLIAESRKLKVVGAAGQFSAVAVDDWAHLYNLPRHALLRVIEVSSDGSFVRFADPAPQGGFAELDGLSRAINFFRTDSLPQLCVFPVSAEATISDVVSAITSQVQGVDLEVTDTGAIRISTARFIGTSALSIPSVMGSARGLKLVVGNYESNDPHVASMESADLTGLASGRIVPLTENFTAPYERLETSLDQPSDAANQGVQIYLGSASGVIRQPRELESESVIKLRTILPAQRVATSTDMRATRLSGIELGQSDNMVFLVDNDAAKKTFDIPMYLEATVTGPSVPSTQEFDLSDAAGEALGSGDRWVDHRFDDYRVWFQAKATIPSGTSGRSVSLKAAQFGPNGQHIRAGVYYPSSPDTPASASFSVSAIEDKISVSINLASGAERTISLQPNAKVFVSVSGSERKIQFLYPTSLSAVQTGDIVAITDPSFDELNRTPMRVNAISNLVDVGHAFEHRSETVEGALSGNTLSLTSPLLIDPAVGDLVSIGSSLGTIASVTSDTEFELSGLGSIADGTYDVTVTEKALSMSGAPVFSVQAGDKIQVGGIVLTVVSALSSTRFEIDLPNQFSGLESGYLSRITIRGDGAGVDETHEVAASQSVRVFELAAASNSVAAISDLVNNTAGVKDLVVASAVGSGAITKSTKDSSGQNLIELKNGESFVYSTREVSPAVRLKRSVDVAPAIGEKVRLIPSTPQNVSDHFNRKLISGLSVAANIALVDQARRVQVSSKTPGGAGQVFAVGGRASGRNVLAVRGNVQEFSSTRAQIELDRSATEFLAPGHTVKVHQPGRAKKDFPITAPTASTTILIDPIGSESLASLTIGVPVVKTYSSTYVSGVKIVVRKIGRSRTRFEVVSGHSGYIPSDLKMDDWVYIGDGESYSGIATTVDFATANQGWFQVRETDGATYFDVESSGVEEWVSVSSATSILFVAYHSARPGDQISIGFDAPVSTLNKGTYSIVSVPSATQVIYQNADREAQPSVELGVGGAASVIILDQGYSTYRRIVMVAPKPSDPTNRSYAIVEPGFDMALLSEGQGAKVSLPNRLGFGADPVPGVAGYSFWTGLKRKVQRIVDGYEPDSASFPGVGAAGVSIEVREPQIQKIQIAVKVKTSRGVSLQALSDTIKSAIAGYVNALGLGQDVVMSEVIRIVQDIPGVDACVLVYPTPGTERVTVGDSSLARIAVGDISLS